MVSGAPPGGSRYWSPSRGRVLMTAVCPELIDYRSDSPSDRYCVLALRAAGPGGWGCPQPWPLQNLRWPSVDKNGFFPPHGSCSYLLQNWSTLQVSDCLPQGGKNGFNDASGGRSSTKPNHPLILWSSSFVISLIYSFIGHGGGHCGSLRTLSEAPAASRVCLPDSPVCVWGCLAAGGCWGREREYWGGRLEGGEAGGGELPGEAGRRWCWYRCRGGDWGESIALKSEEAGLGQPPPWR